MALIGRARTVLLAGLAANICFSFVKGLMPSRAPPRATSLTGRRFAAISRKSVRSKRGWPLVMKLRRCSTISLLFVPWMRTRLVSR